MNIDNTTIEKMAWWIVLLLLILNIATFAKLTIDDNRKFHVLKANQNQIFCVIKAPPSLATSPRPAQLNYINECIKNNQ